MEIRSKLPLALLLLALSARPASPLPLHLVANYWEPYTGQNLPRQGLASEIVLTALQRAGYQVDITIMPWSRVLTTLYQHQADGVVAIWTTNERRRKLLFSDSYLANQLFILHMPGQLQDATEFKHLDGARIGIGRDYEYSDACKDGTLDAIMARTERQLALKGR